MRLGLGLGVNSITSQKIGAGFTGILDEYSGAAAAYSVRRLSSTYTDGLIRVRRSSDDAEQDIGFDANGDLDTTALLAFVQSGSLWDTARAGNLTYTNRASVENDQSIGGRSGVQKFTSTDTNAIFGQTNVFSSGDTNSYTIKIDVYFPTGQDVNGIRTTQPFTSSSQTITQGEWTTVTISGTNSSNLNFILNMLDDGSNAISAGQVVYVDSVTITQTTADGAVTTFYDQSGNGNNATNSTASEQPLVVSGGTLVEENGKAAIQFDGVDDHVKASISITDYPVTNAIVQANDPTNSGYAWSLNNDTQSTQYYSNSDYSSSSIAFHTIRNSASVFFSQSWTDDDQNLLFAYSKANNDHAFGVNGGGLNTSTNSTTFPSVNNIAIGRLRFIGGPLSYLGKIQELIIFTSDQSSNRTGIETNINDHFSIYP